MKGTTTIRLIGLVMLAYGLVMLALMFSPWKDWALDHSIAEVVSSTDRRANNEISGSVDEPMAYAGAGVMIFAGLWFGLLVPWVMTRHRPVPFEPDPPV